MTICPYLTSVQNRITLSDSKDGISPKRISFAKILKQKQFMQESLKQIKKELVDSQQRIDHLIQNSVLQSTQKSKKAESARLQIIQDEMATSKKSVVNPDQFSKIRLSNTKVSSARESQLSHDTSDVRPRKIQKIDPDKLPKYTEGKMEVVVIEPEKKRETFSNISGNPNIPERITQNQNNINNMNQK